MSYKGKIELGEFFLSKDFFEYNPIKIQSQSQEFVPNRSHEESLLMKDSDYFVAFSTQTKSYCVGCVDMVDSTKIAARLPQKQLSTYYEIFLNSMSKIIGKCGGRVIKNIGDCLLFYFPESVNSKIDGMKSCLNCGLVMTEAQEIICRQLESKRLPRLDYRVSADYGSVIIMKTTGSTSNDLIGPPVNMCTKINRCANKNEFVIGGDLKEIVKKYEDYKFEQTQGINVGLLHTYLVFKVSRR